MLIMLPPVAPPWQDWQLAAYKAEPRSTNAGDKFGAAGGAVRQLSRAARATRLKKRNIQDRVGRDAAIGLTGVP